MSLVQPAIAALKRVGARVILFIDPIPPCLDRIKQSGADGVEIYTGSYAAAFRSGDYRRLLTASTTAREAADRGLVVDRA